MPGSSVARLNMRLNMVRFVPLLSVPLEQVKIRPFFHAVFSELLAFLDSSNLRLHSQCGVKRFSEPYIAFVDEVVFYFPTSFLNLVKDIDDVDIF